MQGQWDNPKSWGCSQWRIPKPRLCPAASGSSLVIPASKMGKHRESSLQVFPGDPWSHDQGLRDSWFWDHLHHSPQNPRAEGAATARLLNVPLPQEFPNFFSLAVGTWGASRTLHPNNFPFSQCQLPLPTQVMGHQEKFSASCSQQRPFNILKSSFMFSQVFFKHIHLCTCVWWQCQPWEGTGRTRLRVNEAAESRAMEIQGKKKKPV